MANWIDWLLNNPPKELEDPNVRLERLANEAEKRAVLIEEEVKIRARLVAAKVRIKKAKQTMGTEQLRLVKMVLIVVVVVGVFFLMLKDCGGA